MHLDLRCPKMLNRDEKIAEPKAESLFWNHFCNKPCKTETLFIQNMGTFKTLVGIGVVTGVVVYAFLRKMNGKLQHQLLDTEKGSPQLT